MEFCIPIVFWIELAENMTEEGILHLFQYCWYQRHIQDAQKGHHQPMCSNPKYKTTQISSMGSIVLYLMNTALRNTNLNLF